MSGSGWIGGALQNSTLPRIGTSSHPSRVSRLDGPSSETHSINHKLGVITQFYRFALKKGWIGRLPFDLELI